MDPEDGQEQQQRGAEAAPIYLSVCLSVCLSIYLSIYLPSYIYIYIYIYVCPAAARRGAARAQQGPAGALRRGSVVVGIAGLRRRGAAARRERRVVEDALESFVAALHAAGADVLVAGVLAGTEVRRLLAARAPSLDLGEVREADHLPDAARARLAGGGRRPVVPGVVAHATEVVEEHRGRRVVLRLDEAADGRAGVRRGQRRAVVHDALAEVEVRRDGAALRALPDHLLQVGQVVEAREGGVYAVVLPAQEVLREAIATW